MRMTSESCNDDENERIDFDLGGFGVLFTGGFDG
jgi:hypothetical protein